MHRIPRGLADDDRWAVAATGVGALVALDPGTGAVHWRSGRDLRPCAVTADAVVAVRAPAAGGPEVVVLDRTDGRELWAAALPVDPEWVPRALADESVSSLECTPGDEQVVLRWQASAHYTGGAAPSARVLAESTRTADGAARIDLRSRTVEAVSPGADALTARAASAADEPPARELGPDVVDAGRAGALRVELATPRATGAVVLRGVDEADAVVWEVPLDEQVRRPPPLRP